MTAPAGLRIEGARRETLRSRLQALGFEEVRFAAVAGGEGTSLHDWLDAGHQADLQWMQRTAAKRLQVDLVLPGAQSVIVLGVNYWNDKWRVTSDESKPVWARYALHDDYHDTIKPGLVAAGRVLEEMGGIAATDYRYYVDTGPVLERGWAARTGRTGGRGCRRWTSWRAARCSG